jgi:hypothetical protein
MINFISFFLIAKGKFSGIGRVRGFNGEILPSEEDNLEFTFLQAVSKPGRTFADCPFFFPHPALSPMGRGKTAQKVLEYLSFS